MHRGGVRGAIAAASATIALLIGGGTAEATVIKVNTTADEYGTGTGCSLREAVTAANGDTAYGGCPAGSGTDDVRLTNGSVYRHEIDGNGEDANTTGDLDVATPMSIEAPKGHAILDSNTFDRGIEVLAGGNLKLSRLIITGGDETYPAALVDGTGVKVSGGKLTVERTKIVDNATRGNSSNNGGGLLLASGSAKLDRSTVERNTAGNVGGGISVYQGKLKVRRSTIAGNATGSVGGGMYLGGSTTFVDSVHIRDSTISGNEAGGNGGGIYVEIYGQSSGSDRATLSNVTISGNSSSEYGGGIYEYTGEVDLNAATVTANTADDDASGNGHGGGLAGGPITFSNSIVYGNADLNPTDPLADCDGAGSGGRSVIGVDTGCSSFAKDRTANPKLGPLKKNGGPTATHALKRKSSAIGLAKRSDAPKRDQRGVRRDDHPDSGAYERR